MRDDAHPGEYTPGVYPHIGNAAVQTIVLGALWLLDLLLNRRFARTVVLIILVFAVVLAARVPMPELPALPPIPVPQLLM